MEKPNFHVKHINDYELEFLKEIAAQIAGYEPSHMWGRLTRSPMTNDADHYERFMDISNQEDLAKKIELYGDGFHSTMRHIMRIGSELAKGQTSGINFFSKHQDLHKNVPYLKQVNTNELRFLHSKPRIEEKPQNSTKITNNAIQPILQSNVDHVLPKPKTKATKMGHYFDNYGYGNYLS